MKPKNEVGQQFIMNPKRGNFDPRYVSPLSKDGAMTSMIGEIAKFENKWGFNWHFELGIETHLDQINQESFRENLLLLDAFEEEVTEFLEANCNSIKVMSYYKKNFYCYHFYLNSNILDFNRFEEWFDSLMPIYSTHIFFEVVYDPLWQNIIKTLVQGYDSFYGWTEYLSGKH